MDQKPLVCAEQCGPKDTLEAITMENSRSSILPKMLINSPKRLLADLPLRLTQLKMNQKKEIRTQTTASARKFDNGKKKEYTGGVIKNDQSGRYSPEVYKKYRAKRERIYTDCQLETCGKPLKRFHAPGERRQNKYCSDAHKKEGLRISRIKYRRRVAAEKKLNKKP